MTKVFLGHVRLGSNYFRRVVDNYADDSQVDNTSISFPIAFRKAILQGELPQFTCLLGTMVQEAYDTHPAIRTACDRYIGEHAARVEADLAEAKALYATDADWNPKGAALFSQAVLQGAFILAKAQHQPRVAADCLDHLGRYFETLLPAKAAGEGRAA